MKFENQSFQHREVMIDGHDFIGCRFENCIIQYAGVMAAVMTGCSFNHCTWGMTGPAANAINYMTALYAQGGESKDLIERTFNNIRAGNAMTPDTIN